MRFAKTVTALALACSLALAIPTFAAPAAEEQAGRQEDLELLYQTIRDRHPGPFTNTPEQEFLARIAQIEARIDTEDSMSFGLDLQSLAALIGDSHTTTNLNSILSSGHMFPVSVKWMDGDWVLYQVDASHQGALGQQVTSVNGFSMDQVQEKMAPLISADNEIKLRRQLSQVFGHQEIMVYCGLLKPEEDLTLTLENGTSITLSPLSMQDQSGWPEINGLSQQRQGSAPTDYRRGPTISLCPWTAAPTISNTTSAWRTRSCPWRPSLLRSWPTWSRGAIPSFFWICGTTAAAPTGSSSPC